MSKKTGPQRNPPDKKIAYMHDENTDLVIIMGDDDFFFHLILVLQFPRKYTLSICIIAYS